MKKSFVLFLSSLMLLSNFLYGQRSQTPGQRSGGVDTPRGERPPRGGKPSTGQSSHQGEVNGPADNEAAARGPKTLLSRQAELGSAGIAWYPILKDGLAEARRTNKPILFMAVASQCGGISGVF